MMTTRFIERVPARTTGMALKPIAKLILLPAALDNLIRAQLATVDNADAFSRRVALGGRVLNHADNGAAGNDASEDDVPGSNRLSRHNAGLLGRGNCTHLPSRCGVGVVVMKNCEPFVPYKEKVSQRAADRARRSQIGTYGSCVGHGQEEASLMLVDEVLVLELLPVDAATRGDSGQISFCIMTARSGRGRPASSLQSAGYASHIPHAACRSRAAGHVHSRAGTHLSPPVPLSFVKSPPWHMKR